jgi:hypothetical protein
MASLGKSKLSCLIGQTSQVSNLDLESPITLCNIWRESYIHQGLAVKEIEHLLNPADDVHTTAYQLVFLAGLLGLERPPKSR